MQGFLQILLVEIIHFKETLKISKISLGTKLQRAEMHSTERSILIFSIVQQTFSQSCCFLFHENLSVDRSLHIPFSLACMTTDKKRCVFPFKYNGSLYSSCTNDHHDRAWCATALNVNMSYSSWGDCDPSNCQIRKSYYPFDTVYFHDKGTLKKYMFQG